jgi:hypothetical protein
MMEESFKIKSVVIAFLLCGVSLFGQGPFAPAADSIGSTAVHKDSIAIIDWIDDCTVVRGLQYIGNSFGPVANVGNEQSVYGKADGSVLSLGDGGVATITLSTSLKDHPGADFAIFENGFYDAAGTGYFLELAFVEVSSDGQNFYRFPNQSLTSTNAQIKTFETLDPTNIDGFAGKYAFNYGTPFDLEIMDTVMGLDIQSISHIKVIDVVGSLNSSYVTYDSHGNMVNDPFPTDFGSGGFDLDAIAIMNTVFATDISEVKFQEFQVYPNPVVNEIVMPEHFVSEMPIVRVMNVQGSVLFEQKLDRSRIDVSQFPKGLYFVTVYVSTNVYQSKFIKL